MLAAGALYLRLEKRVTLVLDGEPRPVRTFAGTVGGMLERVGIGVDPHDRISPGVEAPLADGMVVDVTLTKQITLLLDGIERVVYVTGETVQDVLDEINLDVEPQAELVPGRRAVIENGGLLVYEAPVAVRLTADGATHRIVTNADGVGALLDTIGIALARHDEVHPGAGTRLERGLHVRVVRVEVRRAVEERAIPYGSRVRYSDEMYQGQRRVVREGSSGLERVVYEVRREDGRPAGRRVVDRHVVREPVRQVVVEGTKPPRVQTGEASWYERNGMVAAHPSLPFGTSVRVTNLANGRSVTVIIDDRGPFGGRIIDLSDDAFAQIASLGAGVCQVRITW